MSKGTRYLLTRISQVKFGMKNILITGNPGVGKTTIIKKLAENLHPIAGGFLTEEIRERGTRVGFAIKDVHSGRQGILSHIKTKSRFRVGKYGVNVEEFESVGVKALEDALVREGVVIIDEIGKMELFSDLFRQMLVRVFESPHPVIATIRKKKNPFVATLKNRPDTIVFEVTTHNRDALTGEIVKMFP